MALRDRTGEFAAVVEGIVMREGSLQDQARLRTPLLASGAAGGGNDGTIDTSTLTRSEFARAAAQIGRDLNSIVARLQTLATLAKRKTLFDDKPGEINLLITEIKQQIAKVSANIGQLQAWQRQRLAGARATAGQPASLDNPTGRQSQEHSLQVVTSLQTKLATTSEAFKNVLEVRTQNMREQKTRKDQFSALNSASGVGMQGTSSQGAVQYSGQPSTQLQMQNQRQTQQQGQPYQQELPYTPFGDSSLTAPSGMGQSPLYNPERRRGGAAVAGMNSRVPPNSSQNGLISISGLAIGGGSNANARPRSAGGSYNNSGSVAIDFGDTGMGSGSGYGQQQQQQLVPMSTMGALNQELIESRSSAIESIESTIAELGQIYQSFATMVAAQREMVQRIDENVLDVEMNVQGAHTQLMTYFQNIGNNRWLILQVLAVLVVFFLLFIVAT